MATRLSTWNDQPGSPDVVRAIGALHGEFVCFLRRVDDGVQPDFGFAVEATGENVAVIEFWEALHALASERGEAEAFE